MLYLNETEIESLVKMPDVMRVVEDCFRLQGQGKATNQPRRRVYVPDGMMHVMFASLMRENEGYLGLKTYTAFPGIGVRFIFLLWDANSSELLSLMEANLLGQLRTGAASGIAAKYMANESIEEAGLIGTGRQAGTQLEAICLARNIKNFKPNVIFNALHGQFGEDGYIQTILERFKIPYTHSGVIASSIAMDKEISKKIFIKNKINTPKFFTYSYDVKNEDLIKKIKKKLRFPVVVKPLNEGSSVNVYICNEKNIIKILNSIKQYKKVMIEEFIGGREIQVAIMGNKKLGAIELKPKRKFYDYQAKYNSSAKTEHIIPVDLPKGKMDIVMNMAYKAHKVIGCMGVTRSDFKFFNNKFYLLEINTQPGMTKLSLVPEIAAYRGISFLELIEWIMQDASKKK